ncbi:MAG: penicillin-binding protein 1C [Treponema sp.]|nr:penicillin-binding protein 1C [Treponema sp.]
MKNKKKQRILVITLAVVLLLGIAIILDVSINRKKGILSDTQFSGSYSDKDGELIALYLTEDEKFRMYKSVTEYPPAFIEALLLQEDKRFYLHNGINLASLSRSFVETYVKKGRRIGGSTITMQVAKLKYNLYTKNLTGKLKQIFLALRLELIYSKQDILDAYVNLAPCGKNIEGFETASQYLFGKSVNQLELSETLLLCVLPQNPTKRFPSLQRLNEDMMEARRRLFDQWVEVHGEDEEQRNFMNLAPYLVCSFPQTAPHFTRNLELSRPAQSFYGKSSTVKTTLDSRLQKLLKEHLELYVKKNAYIGIENASAILLDASSMEVKAYIGSAGFYNDSILGQIDGVRAKRSPGSTLKPFIYALAMEQGIIHYDTMLKDTPSSFSEYTPDNYGNSFMGPIKAWRALTQSRNIPAVNLARQITEPDLYDFLVEADISELKEKDTYGLSIVLGSADVSPMELTGLYAALVNDGVQYKIKETFSGWKKEQEEKKRLLSEEAAYITRQMLFQNPAPNADRLRQTPGFEIGYKTGTSIGFKDAWTVGFFGQYVLCIWIGNFDGLGNNSFLGRSAAGPLFYSIAESMISKGFVEYRMQLMPEGVKKVQVCSVSGCISNEDCPETELTYFIPGVSPIEKCKIHRRINVDTRTGYRTDETDKPYVQSVVREYWPSDLLALFKQAGLPRLVPPDYPDNEGINKSNVGYPPEILSPLRATQYVFSQKTPDRNVIILSANNDADTKELFWFCGSSFIGRAKPGEKLEWRPEAGNYELTVLDDKGRSSSRRVSISLVE